MNSVTDYTVTLEITVCLFHSCSHVLLCILCKSVLNCVFFNHLPANPVLAVCSCAVHTALVCKKGKGREKEREVCRKQMGAQESGFVPPSFCHDSQAAEVLENQGFEAALSYGWKRRRSMFHSFIQVHLSS